MSEKVREFNRVVHIVYDIDVGGKGHKSEWIAKGHNTLSLVNKTAYDRLAEINKVLTEELQTTLDRYEDMNGGFFDSESKRIRDVIAKAKEMRE